jgi:hypothetical protein
MKMRLFNIFCRYSLYGLLMILNYGDYGLKFGLNAFEIGNHYFKDKLIFNFNLSK